MRLLLVWLINAVALLALPYLVSSITVDSFATALIAALVLGLINAIVRPLLILLTLPATLLTLGLFIFVINAICLALAAWLVPGFTISSFGAALLGALMISLTSWLLSALLIDKKKR